MGAYRTFRQQLLTGVVAAFAAIIFGSCSHGPTAPTTGQVPTLASPQDDAIGSSQPTLTVTNISTAGASYEFQIALSGRALQAGSGIILSSGQVPAGASGQTSFTPTAPLDAGKRYYWRARAVVSFKPGEWTAPFRVRTEGGTTNRPPVIQSILVASQRVETGTDVAIQASVSDAETDPASLTYEWTAPSGSFTSTGAAAIWHAPTDAATPATPALGVTVIDRFTLTDADGQPDLRENRVTGFTSVHLNNSTKELTDLALTFLDDFVHSERSATFCVRNFSDTCPGKQDEFSDITENRKSFINDPAKSTFRISSITFQRNGRNGPLTANAAEGVFATILAPCDFAYTYKPTGETGLARGRCRLTNVYENWQWRLCESYDDPISTTSSTFKFVF